MSQLWAVHKNGLVLSVESNVYKNNPIAQYICALWWRSRTPTWESLRKTDFNSVKILDRSYMRWRPVFGSRPVSRMVTISLKDDTVFHSTSTSELLNFLADKPHYAPHIKYLVEHHV